MDGLGLQARAAGNVAPEAALAWAIMQSSGGSSSSSTSRTSAKAMRSHCMDPGEAGVFANAATVELCIASICLGLAGRGLTRRRRHRTARQAMGKLVRPPLPPYMQADSQALLPQASQDIYVHPASRGVEHALTSDSLRTLCKALASASGSFLSNPEKGLDRTRRPKMDATLTIRALLRYSELRHTAGDDLQPQDYLGESGQGLRALLKHCRNYQLEVASALESREEDTVRMIRAFHDQVDLVKKYLPFFRTTIEKSFPALLRQSVEPMPRLISFLDSFGEVQLSFLYEAAKDKVFKARFTEMQPRHLLEVTDKWVSKARSGELAIVQSHKAKVVVRHVASLDISLPPEERAVWMSLAIWGSVLETSPEVELIEDRIRKGALTRGDPVEMLSLAEGMSDIHGFSDEMFDMIQAPINQAMLRMGPERASQALASLTFRTGYLQKPADKALARLLKPERLVKKVYKWKLGDDRYFPKLKKKEPPKPKKPKEALAGLIVKVLGFFTENMPLTALEYVLAKWVRKNFRLEACYEVASDHLFRIIAGEENLVDPEKSEEDVLVPPGSFARCGQHLVGLGLPGYTFAPAVDWLLCHQVGWTERKAFPEEAVYEDAASLEDATKRRRAAATKLVESSLPLLSHLWPEQMLEGETEDASMEQFSLQNADELLRLVGRTEDRQGRKRKADVAADELVQRLSTQLMFDDLPQKAERAMCAWREDQPETSLSTLVAPLLLEAAHIGAERGMPEQRPVGVLSRSVSLLAQAINMEELSLQSAEWALIPFEAAESSEEAVSLVAASCAVGGVPEDVMAETCTAWLDLGCEPGIIGLQLARTALQVWEREGVRDKGLAQLRKVRSYLEAQLDKVVGIPARTASSLRGALGGLAVLLDAIDGKPPSLSELARAKEAILAELGGKGMAALADAVALSWSMAMPGLRPAVAALHFEQWWNGQENRQELVAQIAGSGLQELSWNLSLKLKATFADKKPTEYASPAWRVEGVQKVPWFVPSGVVKEASKINPVGLQKDRKKPPGFIGSKTAKKGAEEKSGGRCMYCASTYKLRAKHFFPPELGGTDYVSNVSMVCELCSDMHEALGPKRWGEVLSAEPEEAAEVWWEAQKKASMQAMGFLGQPAE